MGIVLCARCRRSFLPRPTGNHIREALRGENHNGEKRDPDAEKIRLRKERRERGKIIRTMIRSGDILGAQRFAFTTIALPSQSEDCPDCLSLQRAS